MSRNFTTSHSACPQLHTQLHRKQKFPRIQGITAIVFCKDRSRTNVVSLGTASSQGPLIFVLNFSMCTSHHGQMKIKAKCIPMYTAAACHQYTSATDPVHVAASTTVTVKFPSECCFIRWHVKGKRTNAVSEYRI